MSTQNFNSDADRSMIDTSYESSWWDLDEVSKIDESNIKFEYKRVVPDSTIPAGSSFNTLSTITFTVNEISQFLVPSKAFLDIKVSITKNAADDITTFTNPSAHVLFSQVRYDIGTSNIEHTTQHYPYSALVRGLLGHSRRWIETSGIDQGWGLDGCFTSGSVFYNTNINTGNDYLFLYTYNVSRTDYNLDSNPGMLKRFMNGFPRNGLRIYPAAQGTAGVPADDAGGDIRGLQQVEDTYNFKIPLPDMFAFCRDIRKVFRGFVHKITLTLNTDINRMIQTNIATARTKAHIAIKNIDLYFPYVVPSLEMTAKMDQYLAVDKMRPLIFYPMYVRSFTKTVPAATSFTLDQLVDSIGHRPMQIYVFMSHLSQGQTGMSPMTFIHNFIKHLNIRVGSVNIPVDRIEMNVEKKQALLPYQMYLDCCGIDDNKEDAAVSYDEWCRIYPIFCFDLTTFPESLFYGSKQLFVNAYFESPVLADGFQTVNNANNANDDVRPNVQSFELFVASVYQKVGKLQTGKDGIKFISS